MLHEAVYDVGVMRANDSTTDGSSVRKTSRALSAGRQMRCEEEFAAIVGLARMAEVIVAIDAAARQVIVNDFVDQGEISHD